MQTHDVLPNRLNFDTIVFCGCTTKEMQVLAIVSLTLCIFTFGLLMKLLIHMFLIGVGLAFPISVALTWLFASVLQKYKNGNPKGYLKQQLYCWAADQGLVKNVYVRRSGKWSIGRRLI